MVSSIDVTFPEAGIDQVSQGFRDNFTFAKAEIEALQSTVISLNFTTGNLQADLNTAETDIINNATAISNLELKTLTDVNNILAPTPNQVLQFNGSLWTSATILTGGLGNVSEDLTPTLGGQLDAFSFKIVNLADPTLAQDAATKTYVDTEISSLTLVGFAGDLNDLADVNAPTPSADQVLQFVGGQWVASTIATGGLGNVVEDVTPQLGGQLDAQTFKIVDMGDPTLAQDSATKNYVDTEIAGLVLGITDVVQDITPQLGGVLDAQTNKIINLGAPTLAADASTKGYVDTQISGLTFLNDVSDDTNPVLGGILDAASFKIANLPTPTVSADAATKGYVDTEISGLTFLNNIVEDITPELSADLNALSHKIVNLLTPVAGTDAANKNYVDNEITAISLELDDLSNVSVAGPSADQVLQFVGSTWVASTLPTGGLGNVVEDASPELGGQLDALNNKIVNLGTPTVAADATTKLYVDTEVGAIVPGITQVSDDLSPTLGGALDAGANKITNLGTPTLGGDAATKTYVDNNSINSLNEDGTPTLSANLNMNGNFLVDSSGDELVGFVSDTTPVNYIQITSGDTGVDPEIQSAGDDGTSNLVLRPKGFGVVQLSSAIRLVAHTPFSVEGDAKTSISILNNTTTDATVTELFFDGSSARLTLVDDSTTFFKIYVVARRTDADNESAAYAFEGVIDRNTGAASTTLVGAVSKTVIAEDNIPWDADVDADTTNGSLRVQVTGEAAKNIRWVAKVEIVEVRG